MLTKNLTPLSFFVLTQRPGLGTTVKLGYSTAGSRESSSSTWTFRLYLYSSTAVFFHPPCSSTLIEAKARQERDSPPEDFQPLTISHPTKTWPPHHLQVGIYNGGIDIEAGRSKTHSGKATHWLLSNTCIRLRTFLTTKFVYSFLPSDVQCSLFQLYFKTIV